MIIGNGQLLQGDCLQLMKQIPDKSVDMVLTDPPYNISRKNNFNTMKGRQGFDFGDWDKGFDQETYLKLCIEKLKDNGGSIIVFNSFENIGIMARVFRECGVEVKCLLRWVKSNPFPRNVNRLYVNNMELALWGVKGKGWVFNKPNDKPYLTGEFNYPVVSGKEKTKHPTQKSLKLISDIVNIHTNSGDLILDPFMGSGTTCVAAQRTNRRFIGMELDFGYYMTAVERVESEVNK